MQHQEWYIERERLLGRIKELEAENAELRKRLAEDVTPIEKPPTAMQNLSLQEKADLFRSLFKGREDVFARRWYSKTSEKAGYQPVCQNEWTPLCDKRTFKCADCPNFYGISCINDFEVHLPFLYSFANISVKTEGDSRGGSSSPAMSRFKFL